MASLNESLFRYALNDDNEIVPISNVQRGEKGFRCRGCLKEMSAVKQSRSSREDFFRHLVKGINENERECIYSNETYRHKIAKELLQKLKRLRLPELIKYSSDKKLKGKIIKGRIDSKNSFKADRVLIEHYVSFNEVFDIEISNQKTFNDAEYWIQPDLIFIIKNQPVLFVEIWETHKVDEKKLEKIRRFGIDTLEIKIPVGTEKQIENSFLTSRGKCWLFNNTIEKTKYESIPDTSQKLIPEFDAQQRRISAKSFECKKGELNNAISDFKRYLGTKQFKLDRGKEISELERIKGLKTNEQRKWEKLQERIRDKIDGRFENEIREIKTEEDRFTDLERRYFAKRSQLEKESGSEQDEEKRNKSESRRIGKDIEIQQRRGAEIGTRGVAIGEQGAKLSESIQHGVERERAVNAPILQRKESIEKEAKAELAGEFRPLFGKVQEEIERIGDEERRLKGVREKRIKQIENPNNFEKDDYFRRVKKVIGFGESLDKYEQNLSTIRRLRSLKELLDQASFKSWKGMDD